MRNHFDVPVVDPQTWALELGGAVERPRRFSLADLRDLPSQTQRVTLECAGHRRSEFKPSTTGVQWAAGAVSEANWKGVRLKDLLAEALPSDRACEVVFQAADRGAHRSSSEEVFFARSIPFERALSGDVLLAWEMNGRPIPPKHGAPLRAIVPGVYAVASVKWLRSIEVLERPFGGPFQVNDYRMVGPAGPENGKPVEELGVSALILTPVGGTLVFGHSVSVSGIAWGGRGGIGTVEFRLRGQPWKRAVIDTPHEPYGLTRWAGLLVDVPPGETRIEVRARDREGHVQPTRPHWNEFGYANNSRHCVSVTTASTRSTASASAARSVPSLPRVRGSRE
ncbi:MAG: sulfite oxidase [Gaiellaceae bacterium]|nr:sulfite oxidase [Gaiellaceae bacterium]